MKFNLKYIDGNNDLPKMAQERMKELAAHKNAIPHRLTANANLIELKGEESVCCWTAVTN